MSIQSNQSSFNQSFTAASAGSKNVEQGTWMYYDQATVATGKSEKTLKRYVKKGELKWRRMGRQINSPVQVWITPELIASVGGEVDEKVDDPDIFDADTNEVDFSPAAAEPGPPPTQQAQESSTEPYERMIKLMVGEFTVQLDRQRDVLFQLRTELQEKEIQLRLLPDLQKQLEAKETEAHLKTTALEKQIEALQTSFQHQGKVVEELQSEKESCAKILEELKDEQEKRAKLVEELQQENQKLRADTELLKTKKSWWSWFTARS
jgi:hypothetical protein